MKVDSTPLNTVSEMRAFLLGTSPDFFMLEVNGTDGDDDLIAPAGSEYLVQSYGGDDVIHTHDGGIAAIVGIIAGEGRDELRGGTAADYALAGSGDDFFFSGRGNDVVFGQAGNDHLFGGGGDDILHGGAGNDVLLGLHGDDIMFGGEGDDAFNGGPGVNTLYGGLGNDYYTHMGETKVFDRAGNDEYYADYNNNLRLNDWEGQDKLYIGEPLDTVNFSRHGDNLFVNYTDKPGSIAILGFFKAGRAIETLYVDDLYHDFTALNDMTKGETRNGDDIW